MRKTIRESREAALALLQPSEKDLQHGLELHADALVCDAYGLGVGSAPDGDALRAAEEDLASPDTLRDLIAETRITGPVRRGDLRAEFLEAWDATGVTCIVQNAGEECQDPLTILKRLAHYQYQTDFLAPAVSRARRPEDILRARETGGHCIYPMTCGVPLPQRWRSAEEELALLPLFFQLGVRMMHVTYNRRNMLGEGCAETNDGGLSDFGAAAVREMNRVGIIVDLAHSSWNTCLDAARVSSRPVIVSHSAVHSLNAHCRCKSDEVIRAVVDTGGIMGICCISRFLGGSGTIHAFLDHIDYVARKFGVDAVAIGTDKRYVSETDAAERAKASAGRRARLRWEKLWPRGQENGAPGQPAQHPSLDLVNFPLFTVGLVQRGYSDDDIRRILGENFMRAAKAVFDKSCYRPV